MGHLEIVRFLVGSGASKDQGWSDTGHLEVPRLMEGSGARKRPRLDRHWSNSLLDSISSHQEKTSQHCTTNILVDVGTEIDEI